MESARIDRRRVFANHELFRSFTAAEIEHLVGFSRVQRYRAGEIIYEKGSPGHCLMAVLSGTVKISSPSFDGRQIVLNVINPGEIFGEIALLDGKDRSADATAMSSAELLILERRDFVPFIERHPEICLRLISVLCERLRRTTAQVEDVLFLNLESRLAKTLVQLAELHGQKGQAGIKLDLRLSQRDLASMIGASRESVNRQLGLWQEGGYITLDHGAVTITDIGSLRDMIDAEA